MSTLRIIIEKLSMIKHQWSNDEGQIKNAGLFHDQHKQIRALMNFITQPLFDI